MTCLKIDTDFLRMALKKFERPEEITMCLGEDGIELSGKTTKTIEEEIPEPPYVLKRKEILNITEKIPIDKIKEMELSQPLCCELDGNILKNALKKKRDIGDDVTITWDDEQKALVFQQRDGVIRKIILACNNFER